MPFVGPVRGFCGGQLRPLALCYTQKSRERTSGELFADIGKKCGENRRCSSFNFQESGRRKFHKNSSTNFTSQETKFSHRETLVVGGPTSGFGGLVQGKPKQVHPSHLSVYPSVRPSVRPSVCLSVCRSASATCG